jgi:hypothetical protein
MKLLRWIALQVRMLGGGVGSVSSIRRGRRMKLLRWIALQVRMLGGGVVRSAGGGG